MKKIDPLDLTAYVILTAVAVVSLVLFYQFTNTKYETVNGKETHYEARVTTRYHAAGLGVAVGPHVGFNGVGMGPHLSHESERFYTTFTVAEDTTLIYEFYDQEHYEAWKNHATVVLTCREKFVDKYWRGDFKERRTLKPELLSVH